METICIVLVSDEPRTGRGRFGGETHGSSKEARGSYSADGSPDDKRHRVGGRAADGRANLEEQGTGKEDGSDGEDGVDLSEQQLKGAGCEEV